MNKRFNKYIIGKYDPFELNSIWFHEQTSLKDLIPKDFKVLSVYRFYLVALWLLLKVILKSLANFTSINSVVKHWESIDKRLLFFIPTLNNQRAVSSIIQELRKKNKDFIVIDKPFDRHYFPMLEIGFFSINYLPRLYRIYKQSDDSCKRIVLYNLSFFLLTPGITWFYEKVLSYIKPECIIFANDHMSYCRSLALMCEDHKIKTIYVQHASVSGAFPELHYTYSFLDGMDSLIKYNDGIKKSIGNIILLGALRYDSLSRYRVTRGNYQRKCIGIAINDLDDNYVVNNLCNILLEKFPDYTLKVRSHPALKNRPFVFDNKDRISYTCASDESIIEYIDSIDFQISGDSGIHFDAIIGGIQTYVFNLSTSFFSDNYRYVENGLIRYAESQEQLLLFLSSRKNEENCKIISLYDASYGKKYAGNCSKIVSDFIFNGYQLDYLKKHYDLNKIESGQYTYYMIPH